MYVGAPGDLVPGWKQGRVGAEEGREGREWGGEVDWRVMALLTGEVLVALHVWFGLLWSLRNVRLCDGLTTLGK